MSRALLAISSFSWWMVDIFPVKWNQFHVIAEKGGKLCQFRKNNSQDIVPYVSSFARWVFGIYVYSVCHALFKFADWLAFFLSAQLYLLGYIWHWFTSWNHQLFIIYFMLKPINLSCLIVETSLFNFVFLGRTSTCLLRLLCLKLPYKLQLGIFWKTSRILAFL